MNAGMVVGATIFAMVALVMVIIGIVQFVQRNEPVGFYNVIAPPKKEEITDIVMWNRQHGIIWILYGVCIELGFWLGALMPSEMWGTVFMIGGVVIPLPFMILRHHSLVKRYGK